MEIIYRFKSGWTGDILEIKNPTEIKRDKNGALLKAVWYDEKGKKQTIEWNDIEQRYTTKEEALSGK